VTATKPIEKGRYDWEEEDIVFLQQEKAMPIKPGKDESQSDWMSRCVSDMMASGDREQDQAVAACLQMWRDKDKSAKPPVTKQPEPEPDEDYQDFMDRCMESDDEDTCQLQWDNRAALVSRTTKIDRDGMTIEKTHAGHIDGAEYVLSDETIDRMGDVIQSDGWRLESFKRNPIALFNHRADFIIGSWKNLRVEDGVLRGHLKLAPEGTSPRIDEIRKLVDAGILKATSVGFKPLKYEALNKDSVPPNPFGGLRFLEQELVETSLVSVPANPNALAIAKNLDISDTTLRLVFAGQGERTAAKIVRRTNGGHADTKVRTKDKAMSLAQTIVETQSQLALLRDGLQQHLDTLDNDNVSDAQMQKTDEFHSKIARTKRVLDQHIESEKALGLATSAEHEQVHEIRMPTRKVEPTSSMSKVPAEAGKAYKPGDHTWKALTCLVKMQGDRYRKASSLDVIRDTCGENDKVRAVFDILIGKAASVPALTTATGWAAELVRTDIQGFMESLQPAAVATRLLAKGLQFSFGTNGIISIPTRSATPTIAGSFVGEGAPIPVRQGAFTAITMTPKKLAVITVFSREISEHSDPAIEGLLRNAITEDTAVAVDSVLLDANAATAVRPAGLRNGISTLTPTTGGGFAAVVGDVKLLVAGLTTSTLGNIRNPVWLMSPLLELALRLTVAPNTGVFPFAAEINAGTFAGYPVIVSPNVTADTLFLIDAADLVSSSGEPRFDVSDSATVHMEDSTPLAISSSGTPNTVAAPVRSFWQTDTLGIRMIMPLNWAFRRAGMVAYITGTTWD
jgi:HK97 family phage major capsid protein/HK97 family phage prohead protease